MQHGRIDEGRKLRLAANDVFRLAAHAIPDRIERRQFGALRIDLMHCHGLLSNSLNSLVSLTIIARRADLLSPGSECSAKVNHRRIPTRSASARSAQIGRLFPEIKPGSVRLLVNFGSAGRSGHGGPETGGSQHHHADFARARRRLAAAVWIAAVAIPLLLIAPALWNGYPLLQWDTGGYLARWYEGYLVPSRSTVFGLYLHFGEDFGFWINLGIQALATLWILQLTLRVLGMAQPLRLLGDQPRADPDHRAALACEHAADRHLCRAVGAGALHPGRCMASRTSTVEKCLLFALTAFAAATHSATLAVLLGLCCVGWIVRPFLARADFRCRTGARQPHPRRRRGDAAVGEFCAVGTIGLDARRLRRRVRTHDAGWHRRALPAAIIARSRN